MKLEPMPSRRPTPTTMRIPEDLKALIDAWAAYIADRRHTRPSRTDVLYYLLERKEPPAHLDPVSAEVRRAHKAVSWR